MTIAFDDILSSGTDYYDVEDTVVEDLTDVFELINSSDKTFPKQEGKLENISVFEEKTKTILIDAFIYGRLLYRLNREIYVITDSENRYLLAYDSEEKAVEKTSATMYKYIAKTINDHEKYLDEYISESDVFENMDMQDNNEFSTSSSFTEKQNMICWSCIELGKRYEEENPHMYGVFTVYDNLAAIYATKHEAENSVSSDGYVDKIQLSDIN